MSTETDPAVAAVRTALADPSHDLGEVIVGRPGDTARFLIVRFNPVDGEDFDAEGEMHAAYTIALRAAGWRDALDLGDLVLVPEVPLADTEPGTFIASWAITIDRATDVQDAADQARERQLDLGVTEAVWTVTDSVGRTATVHTQDPDLS
ncbi:hypothetical protein ACH41H_25095 [Streptomyces sp. NPDC020800]|uniref:hypothetical protein n=1 Tax=Streptomyces sp. NPDC020800 TaxID=3365092 RepID=UPI0037B69752